MSNWNYSPATNIDDYRNEIAADFALAIDVELERQGLNQRDLAQRLNVAEAYVSRALNHPGNATLKTLVKLARALDLHLSLVTYRAEELKSPLTGRVFEAAWSHGGKPTAVWSLTAPGGSPAHQQSWLGQKPSSIVRTQNVLTPTWSNEEMEHVSEAASDDENRALAA